MKKQIGLIGLIALLVSFMAFSGVASAQASNVSITFFESPTCSACKTALPIVQSAAAKYGVTVNLIDVTDVSQGKGIGDANGVSVTPTIIVSGAQSARIEGSVTQAQIEAAIKAAIGTTTPTPTATPAPTKTVVKAVVTTTPTPTATPAPTKTVVKQVATATPTTPVATASAQPTITVVTPTVTPTKTTTASTSTVPEFSLIGLGAPALLVGAIYLFLRRR